MSGSTYYRLESGNLCPCTRHHNVCPCKRNKVSLMSVILFPVHDFNNAKDLYKLTRHCTCMSGLCYFIETVTPEKSLPKVNSPSITVSLIPFTLFYHLHPPYLPSGNH